MARAPGKVPGEGGYGVKKGYCEDVIDGGNLLCVWITLHEARHDFANGRRGMEWIRRDGRNRRAGSVSAFSRLRPRSSFHRSCSQGRQGRIGGWRSRRTPATPSAAVLRTTPPAPIWISGRGGASGSPSTCRTPRKPSTNSSTR